VRCDKIKNKRRGRDRGNGPRTNGLVNEKSQKAREMWKGELIRHLVQTPITTQGWKKNNMRVSERSTICSSLKYEKEPGDCGIFRRTTPNVVSPNPGQRKARRTILHTGYEKRDTIQGAKTTEALVTKARGRQTSTRVEEGKKSPSNTLGNGEKHSNRKTLTGFPFWTQKRCCGSTCAEVGAKSQKRGRSRERKRWLLMNWKREGGFT